MVKFNNKNGWFDGVKKIVSPNYNTRQDKNNISLLVIHNISLPTKKFNNNYVEDFFLNNLDYSLDASFATLQDIKVSAHFYIKRSGEIIQFVSVYDRAWHAGVSCFKGTDNCNDYSIGIELAGADDIDYESEQYISLVSLTKLLQHNFPKVTTERIVGHADIAPDRKTDPGTSFNWLSYKSKLDLSSGKENV